MSFQAYTVTFWGLFVVLLTYYVQMTVAAVVKAKQPGAIPGRPPQDDDHSSFVFRTYRTHLNSLENFAPFWGAAILCILLNASVLWTTILVWTYALGRIIHMVLFYKISTNKNPSPRTHFFFIAYLANFGLFIVAFLALISY